METKMNINSIESNELATPTVMSEAVEQAGTVPPKTAGQIRLYLSAGWHFTRHLLEMVIAMIAGMAVLGVAVAVLGEAPGFANLLVEYGVMGVFMSAPMVAWMRYRGHSWWDGLEMTVAMLVPMFALVLPVELGTAARYVPWLSDHSLMLLSHVAMIAGMAILMIYRWDRYAHGAHSHHKER
jgi:hypothetical protein